jgi:hypothetical protein
MKVLRDSDGYIVNAAVLQPGNIHQDHVRCPACADFAFFRWPSGWGRSCSSLQGLERRDGRRAQSRIQARCRVSFSRLAEPLSASRISRGSAGRIAGAIAQMPAGDLNLPIRFTISRWGRQPSRLTCERASAGRASLGAKVVPGMSQPQLEWLSRRPASAKATAVRRSVREGGSPKDEGGPPSSR